MIMPPIGPIKRKELIKVLKRAGFEGPFIGGKHDFMIMGELRLVIPNLHHNEIGKELVVRILRQANISREEWEKL
jgi:predicted RNA binding protein YcfA (HicA-like mRNA interferase family)